MLWWVTGDEEVVVMCWLMCVCLFDYLGELKLVEGCLRSSLGWSSLCWSSLCWSSLCWRKLENKLLGTSRFLCFYRRRTLEDGMELTPRFLLRADSGSRANRILSGF